MREIIDTLNEMSFELPKGYNKTRDIYDLPNGQGMENVANYLSDDGKVISLFAIHRSPDEFFESYDRLCENKNGKFQLISCPSVKANGFVFPCYIVRGHDKPLITFQFFCDCGDALAVFMVNLNSYDGNFAAALKREPALVDLMSLMRTIE